jgi:TonB-linked SusC/RagA family outer membrane protein
VLFIGTVAEAQNKISGTVKDQNGDLVPYATVKVVGSKVTVAADANAYFTIQAKTGDVLSISAVGIENTEVTVGSDPVITVTVNRVSGSIDDVVVTTALGIKRNRNTLPYAAQQISGDEMNRSAVSMNPVSNLSGKIAGLHITQENSMGGSTNVILRGIKSLTQSNQALFVVDGVPFDNSNYSAGGYDLGNSSFDLNPNDIASVSVLKGAAASALYGSRASNGVILITTKKGIKRKGIGVTVNLGATTGSFDNSTLPTYQTKYGEGYGGALGFVYNMPTFFSNDPVDIVETDADAATGPLYDPGKLVYNWDAFSPGDPNYKKATPWEPAAHYKPQDFFVKPVTSTVSVFAQGGGDKASFKFGYSHDEDKDFIPNSRLKKNIIDFSSTYKLIDNLSITGSIEYSDNSARNRYIYPYGSYGGQLGAMADFRQWWPTNVDLDQLKKDFFNSDANISWNWATDAYMDNTSSANIVKPAYHDNPYWFVYKNYESDARTRFFGNVHLDWTINSWLSAMVRVSKDYYSQIFELRQDVGSTYTPNYSRTNYWYDETNYDAMLNLNKKLSNSFVLRGVLGSNIRQTKTQSIASATSGGLVVPGLFALSNSVSTPAAPSESYAKKEVDGIFAGATLDYKEILTLDATVRRDRSSTLPKDNNSYYYPSASLNFQFGQLLQSVPWLSHAKAWVNYAEVGGDAPVFATINTYTALTPISGESMFATPTTNNNANLVPERQKSAEAGIEASFLKDKIGFSVTYYHARQIDQIMPINVSTSTGFASFYVNGGTVQNSGIEASLNLVPIRSKNFSWNIDVNWSKNNQKVISLYNNQPTYVVAGYQNSVRLVAEPGKPYQLQGTKYKYNDKGQRLIDDDGYPILEDNPYSDLGTPNPDWIGGINNTFKYKNLALSFLIDVRQGGVVYSLDMDYGSFSGLYPQTAGNNSNGKPVRGYLADGNGYLYTGVVESTGKPNTQMVDESGLYTGNWTFSSAGAEAHEQFVYDASFVKLREVVLTYSLPARIFQNGARFIKGIDISLSGRNLWIIHKNLPYADPEQGQASGNASMGFQNGAYPTVRTMGAALKVNF